MKVFISWSGQPSRQIAEALRAWLPRVIQSLKPWMSDEDIAPGSRWLPDVANQLNDAKIGLICVTPDNWSNPWLVFEAGALSKTLEQTFVCPLLHQMAPSQLSGPLAQFQSLCLDKPGMLRALQNLNQALGDDKLSDHDLSETFEVWWPRLEKTLNEIPKNNDGLTSHPRTTEDILEEILDLSREQIRRENLRLEAASARDKEISKVLPIFDQMHRTMLQLQERSETAANFINSLPIAPEIKSLLTGPGSPDVLRAPISSMEDMMKSMQEHSKFSSQITDQLLTPPPKSESKD